MNRISILDSLRGYCALWVALVHLATVLVIHTKYSIPSSKYGVEIFFIISGYVIAMLLAEKKESYGKFIVRRYLRLAPAFIFYCLLYIVFTGFILDVLNSLDVSQQPIRSRILTYKQTESNWLWHLLAHITMLHGLFENWLTGSLTAIIPAGWTMTVEWQFYLVAPFIIGIFHRCRAHTILLVMTLLFLSPLLIFFKLTLFTAHLANFLVGIASYYCIHHRRELMKSAGAIMVMVLIGFFASEAGRKEVLIWVIFMILAYGNLPEFWHKSFQFIFDNSFSRFLGRISYSFYLSHMLCLYASIYLISQYVDAVNEPELFYFCALPIMLVMSILISYLTYRYIEQPIIQWSKQLVGSKPPD